MSGREPLGVGRGFRASSDADSLSSLPALSVSGRIFWGGFREGSGTRLGQATDTLVGSLGHESLG